MRTRKLPGWVAWLCAGLLGAIPFAAVQSCNSVLAVGDFQAGACNRADTRCSGNTPQTCPAGQWESLSPCDPGTCEGGQCVGPCKSGDKRCEGNSPETCDAQGYWQHQPACVDTTCTGGSCLGECAPDSTRCAGDTPQTCDAGGWQGSTSCVFGLHCQAGVCVVSCTSGDLRCVGPTAQSCDASGEWHDDAQCLQQTCSLGACVGVCAPGEGKCTGATPETCDASGEWKSHAACTGACVEGSCPGPSCEGLAANCGPALDESCCRSPVVLGGGYKRSNDSNFPATVSDFRLDRFEVTVGRFRKFVNAYPKSKPQANAGAHPLIPKSGWDPTWNVNLPSSQTALKASLAPCTWKQLLVWTDEAGANEDFAMGCITWYEAFAFCAWDGGRLPTEAEWNYAAAAGAEQRVYPWAIPPAAPLDPTYALYNSLGDGSPQGWWAQSDIMVVGSRSPKGDGKWGQADLGGGMQEWVLDWFHQPYPAPCKDCAALDISTTRLIRGGSWFGTAQHVLSSNRDDLAPTSKDDTVGVRCARAP